MKPASWIKKPSISSTKVTENLIRVNILALRSGHIVALVFNWNNEDSAVSWTKVLWSPNDESTMLFHEAIDVKYLSQEAKNNSYFTVLYRSTLLYRSSKYLYFCVKNKTAGAKYPICQCWKLTLCSKITFCEWVKRFTFITKRLTYPADLCFNKFNSYNWRSSFFSLRLLWCRGIKL